LTRLTPENFGIIRKPGVLNI